MAGSQAVIAHDEEGRALFVEYYPPDIHLSHVIVGYCQKVSMATGAEIFVIDREVNSVAMACAFEQKGWGLLSMLDSNEYDGPGPDPGFEATPVGELEDGSPVYSGRWKEPQEGDPRSFVLVEPPEGRVLVYWGTPKVKESLEPIEWPKVYRQRNEIQENGFKGMIDHGALDINYGRKKIIGPDRHQQRAKEKIDQALEGAHQKVEKKESLVRTQQEKVAGSEQKGHKKRLEQRQRALVVREEELKEKVSLETILRILFERSGSRIETGSEVIYWINTAGLSASYQRMLAEIAEGLCAMNLQCRGKPIRVCLREMPP